MSHIAVERIHKGEDPSFFEEAKYLAERVRERAFQLFEHRGSRDGGDLEDWLQAERELVWSPESELVERDGHFELQVAVPGFDAKDVAVTAMPGSIVVRAKAAHKHDESNGEIRFREFAEKSLFRRFDLPSSINVDKVTANLDDGVLKLNAIKAGRSAARQKPKQRH